MPALRPTLLALALALPLSACDSAASGPGPEANTFTLRVGEAEVQTRRGAYVGEYVSDATGRPTFAILLGTDPIASALALEVSAVGLIHDGANVAAGAHTLVGVNPDGAPPPGEFVGFYLDPAAYVSGESPPRSGFYFTGSGSVRLDEVTGERVRGTFTMDAVEYESGAARGGATPSAAGITVTGEFHAVRSEAFGAEGALLGRRPSWLRWLPFAG